MKVFCALMTMTGNSGPQLLDARQQVEGVFVRHHHVGDDEIALALLPSATASPRFRSERTSWPGARERLVEHGADRRVVVGDKNVSSGHGAVLTDPRAIAPFWVKVGNNTRNVVRLAAGYRIRRCRHGRR
jgi:hypothetical protein